MHSAFNSSVFDKLILAIERTVHARIPGLSRSTRLVEDLALSRLDRMKLAMCLEDIFDVELEDNVVKRFVDLGGIADYLSDRYIGDIEPSTLAIAV